MRQWWLKSPRQSRKKPSVALGFYSGIRRLKTKKKLESMSLDLLGMIKLMRI